MIKNYFIVDKDERLESIIQKIVLNAHRAVLVIERKKVIGLISEGDILKSLVYKKNMNATASTIMNKSFKFLLKKDMTLAKKMFQRYLCSFIPIVNSKMELKDLITLEQLLSKSEMVLREGKIN